MKGNTTCTLSELPLGEEAVITGMPKDEYLCSKLVQYGITNKVRIKKVYCAPLSDPCAYLYRGTLISLRNSDAEKIIVSCHKKRNRHN